MEASKSKAERNKSYIMNKQKKSVPKKGAPTEKEDDLDTVHTEQTSLNTQGKDKPTQNVKIIPKSTKLSNTLNSLDDSVKGQKLKTTDLHVGKLDLPNPTKLPLTKESRKTSYYIPILITMVILPLLGSGLYILYRMKRDSWKKQYYRRMDIFMN